MALNSATLPVFIVDGKTHIVTVRTDLELTRLVDTSAARHGYLVKSGAVPRLDSATRAVLGFLQKKATRNALDNFVLQIARQLKENPKVGYLVKVNKSAALEGAETLNSGLLTPIGFGMEPLDALAESYRIPAYRASSSPMPDTSEYVWYTWTNGELTPARYDLDFPRQLERQAQIEADRRFVLGNVKLETGTGIARAQVAEYWREFSTQRLALIKDFDLKKRIADMSARLQVAQDQFNFAYENYQSAAREMARNAAEMQTLDRIGSVISLLKTGAEAVQAAKDWRAQRQASLNQTKDTHRQLAQSARQEMVETQKVIIDQWSTAPGTAWQSPVIPEINLKLEVIETKPYLESGQGTTQIILYRD